MWYQLIDKVKEKLEPIAAVFQYNETGAKNMLSKYTRSIQGDMLIDDHDDDESVYDFVWTKFVRSNIWELINMMNIAKCYLVERPHNLCIISKQIVTSLEKIENKLPLAQAFDWLIDWWTIDIFLVIEQSRDYDDESTDRKTPNEVKPAEVYNRWSID